MITHLSHATIWVTDQDAALDFYVGKLGFEKKSDEKMGDFRWLTVSPPQQNDLEIVLMKLAPGPMLDQATADKLGELLAAGALGSGVMAVDDCRATYDELRAKGVAFAGEPQERFYGIEAILKDPFGNWFSMTQRTDG